MNRFFCISAILLCLFLASCGMPPAPSQSSAAEEPSPAEQPQPVVLISDTGDSMKLMPDTESIVLDGNSFVQSLSEQAFLLRGLRSISFSDGSSFSKNDIAALRSSFPNTEILYNVIISGNVIPPDSSALDLSDCSSADMPELVRELPKLELLESVNLIPSDSVCDSEDFAEESKNGLVTDAGFSPEDVKLLCETCPDIFFKWKFLLYGKAVSTEDERLEYVNCSLIGDEGLDNFRRILPAMSRLSYLLLDNCGTTSESMATLRDEFPEIKTVWRVWFGYYGQCGDGVWATYNCLTDTEKIWATGNCRDDTTADLKYCTDVRYLDMGHNVMTNIDFINYMPKLEVCVLSITYIDDLSPFANCPDLEFLELFRTYASDLSPLANCSKLEHLYVYDEHRVGLTDISPVMGLNSLKRFYCTMADGTESQTEEFIRLHPDCETDFTWVFIGYTHWRTINGVYAERYALLREQIGYDRNEYSR